MIQISEMLETPLGPIWIAVGPLGLIAIEYQIKGWPPPIGPLSQHRRVNQQDFIRQLERRGHRQFSYDPQSGVEVMRQLSEYLSGQRRDFSLPVDWQSLRPFQERVLRATYAIPYGQVTTYLEIARQIGNPAAARAIGRAEATNPMPLVLPCHRVLGSDGKLHGYGGPQGLATKEWLLQLEKRS